MQVLADFEVKNGFFFVKNQLDAQFFFTYDYFYSIHVSGRNVPIIRRINCKAVSSKPAHQTVIYTE
jgi:hypothetical protein